MNSGKNIHNAFVVVYETYKSVQKLISKCQNEIDDTRYHIPFNGFLRYSSDVYWGGWIYYSFILLFQRRKDGKVMKNNWINAPIYAVEINLDADTCDEPELIVAKMNFGNLSKWVGSSKSDHWYYYEPIHKKYDYYNSIMNGEFEKIFPAEEYAKKVEDKYAGLQNLVIWRCPLVEVRNDNYQDKIFGTIERLSRYSLKF
jgi:hypothetical protein